MIRATLRRFNEVKSDKYNCFVSLRKFQRSPQLAGALGNTTFAAKDNIATKLDPTTCGSRILENYTSPFLATVVDQLESAGLVLVGKTNMDEFGMGSSTTSSFQGPTRNPRFTDQRIAGGSSGGSAAVVAAGLADFALGTDTGGSVRQPASYCGIVGFKPSYGRISRYGVVAYAQGLDCVGIFSKKVDLTKRVYSELDQVDGKDITCMPQRVRDAIKKSQDNRTSEQKLRIGLPQEYILEEVHPETLDMLESCIKKLVEKGHTVHPVSIPSISKLLAAYYTLATAEAASNLSRFDGLRYGSHPLNPNNGVDTASEANGQTVIARERSRKLGEEVQRRIILGNYTLSSEGGDNYQRATKHRNVLVLEFNDVFNLPHYLSGTTKSAKSTTGCDILIGPTTFGKAPTFDEYEKQKKETFLNDYLNDIFTVPASLAGLPAISVPYGNGNCGVQIMGQYGDDDTVLHVAEMIEQMQRE